MLVGLVLIIDAFMFCTCLLLWWCYAFDLAVGLDACWWFGLGCFRVLGFCRLRFICVLDISVFPFIFNVITLIIIVWVGLGGLVCFVV